jgi:hypothetical protein
LYKPYTKNKKRKNNYNIMALITTGLTIMASQGSWYFGELPIRADQDSIDQFCTEKGYTAASWTADSGGYSNDGGRLMNYYGTYQFLTGSTFSTGTTWLNYFGYDGILTSITT